MSRSPSLQSPGVLARPTDTEIAFLRLPQVIAATGLSRSSIYVKVRDPADPFPAPRHYSDRRGSFWTSVEIRDWQRRQIGDEFDALLAMAAAS